MSKKSTIVFVCEHGAAKSILAAAYFNTFASELGSDLRAIARGTHPDEELSSQTVTGLSKDGLQPPELIPQRLTKEDLKNAQRLITFCELPAEYQSTLVEAWDDVPAVSKNYEHARDAIVERIRQLLNS